ncbi:hypothetical protein LCGC14_2110840, partial [marine sediment metagenome]
NKVTIAGDFYKAVINLEHRLRSENFFPPFALLSDSKTKIMAEIGPHYYEVPRKTEKRIIEEKNEIVEWMDLVNANNSEENDHKLVCIAFLNHIPNGHKLVVNHINFDKLDNRVENLELWSSNHPKGCRVTDQILWAKEILNQYKGFEKNV